MGDNINSGVAALLDAIFAYKGTNCARVANELGMTRQNLFRMIKNGTLRADTFFDILRVLDIDVKFVSGDKVMCLERVPGDRVRRKIRGVVYDTDRMFLEGEDDGKYLCFDPASGNYVIMVADEPRTMILAGEDEISSFYKREI